ncbi:MAG: ribosome biogenesis GTPase Der [Actinomycetota bacterium]
MDKNIPKVAIIGKPNVGKSTLINRICKKGEAIVHKDPMITRDRKYYMTDWNGKIFYLMDTGGIDMKSKQRMDMQIYLQTKKAIDESDIIIFMVDLKQPLSLMDEEIASLLRKTDKEIIFTGNKYDDIEGDYYVEDFLKFGFGYPIKISALHGTNTGDLLDEIVSKFKKDSIDIYKYEEEKVPAICILGKPNTGKSTLFNAIIRDERAIVDEIEGTTRDSIDSMVKINNKIYKFIDTAGMRKKKIKEEDLDYYSGLRTLRAIEKSDISLILIDCNKEVTEQDVRIIETCIEKGLSICVIFNKIDIADRETVNNITNMFNLKLKFANYIPFIKISALAKKGIGNIIKMIDKLMIERKKEISDNMITGFFKKLDQETTGVFIKGKRFKIKFIRQIKSSPPVFLVYSNMDVKRKVNIIRYIENSIRDKFGFMGTPIYFKFKY